MAVPASAVGSELADLLRSRRARLQPEDVGLPPGRRRRTSGLRREEVALLAAISPTYYTYLEQGRDLRPSREVLDALARALRLSGAERRHLHELAHGTPPPDASRAAPDTIAPALAALVERLDPAPAYVKSRRWDILAANASATALFDGWSVADGPHPNMLWWMFTAPRARKVYADWEQESRAMLARFRMSAARHPDDPEFLDLIGLLSERAPGFAAAWERHEVRAPGGGRKRLRHPTIGTGSFEHAVLLVADDPEQTLVTFEPVGGGEERLAALAAAGRLIRSG